MRLNVLVTSKARAKFASDGIRRSVQATILILNFAIKEAFDHLILFVKI